MWNLIDFAKEAKPSFKGSIPFLFSLFNSISTSVPPWLLSYYRFDMMATAMSSDGSGSGIEKVTEEIPGVVPQYSSPQILRNSWTVCSVFLTDLNSFLSPIHWFRHEEVNRLQVLWRQISESLVTRVFDDGDGQHPVRKCEQLPFRLGNLILRFIIVEDYPLGYPRVAAFMNSDENFLIYRQFSFLHARILLRKQDELRTIEGSLDDLDHQDFLES